MSCTIVRNLIRTPRESWKVSAAIAVFVLFAAAVSSAQATFTNLFDFDGADGQNPTYVYLVQGTDGQLYGTTQNGGNGYGNVYKITTTGSTFTQLWSFCSLTNCADGGLPVGGLALAPNGNFYGTASVYGLDTQGTCDTGIYGCGTIFEMTPAGVVTVLHTFTGPDGFLPYANLTLGTDGNLYGTTLYGGNIGANGCSGIGCGTVFKISTQGKFTSIYSFQGGDGQNPIGRLFQGSNGSFYGTTFAGGANAFGTIFEISPAGKLTTLYNFGDAQNGPYDPYGGVLQSSNGTIYGTTAEGGANSYGTVYTLVGTNLTVLYSFCSLTNCADGNYPYGGLIQATDGNFYGTTGNGGPSAGTVFEITPSGSLNTLYTFCSQSNCMDGSGPYGDLLQATDGNFYGTTAQGGEQNQYGTIFSISNGLAPFVQAVTGSAKVGTKITILGTNLTGATAVSFSGTAATFSMITGSAINATVPGGATTGKIQVRTPGGTFLTPVAFKVTPQLKTFSPRSGAVGTQVTIKGMSLTQTLKVTFGGVAATFTVNSDQQVTATVPSGAKTGKIAITTPGGTASSATNFTVT